MVVHFHFVPLKFEDRFLIEKKQFTLDRNLGKSKPRNETENILKTEISSIS
jgi:hypothetical protein